MIFLLVVHRAGKDKKKIAQRGFKGIATVILRKKHEQLETKAAALLLISLLPVQVQSLADGLGSAFTQL